jgi:restriction endonuclease Mrr
VIPNSLALRNALIEVLQANPLGLKSKEIDSLVAINLNISDDDLKLIRSGTRTEFAYRMAWERTHAKAKGKISKLPNGFWKIV